MPAVNVKVYGSVWDVKLPLDLGSFSEDQGATWQKVETAPGFTMDWVEENISETDLDAYFWQTCADGFEQLQSQADEIWAGRYRDLASISPRFGRSGAIKVYSEGRSGGWAVVDGLAPIESWDAIDLARWAKFARIARVMADDIPRAVLDSIYANRYPQDEDSIDAATGQGRR